MRRNQGIMCKNCGKIGHVCKNCNDPITSFGIIAIHFPFECNLANVLNEELSTSLKCTTEEDLNKFSQLKQNIKLLLIQRKHSLGFMEFVRGHYKADKPECVINLYKQMTPQELIKIRTKTFEELWNDIWNGGIQKGKEFNDSYQKYIHLENEMITYNEKTNNLKNISEYINPSYAIPEWGFPKGRRKDNEYNIDCAMREFEEETNIKSNSYEMLDIEPYVEDLIGTDGKKYRHVYYLALLKNDVNPTINTNNHFQATEIGNIGLFNFDDILIKIREYHVSRRQIACTICMKIINHFMNV